MEKENEGLQDQIQKLLNDKMELKIEIGKVKNEKAILKGQYESLKESFGAFKESLAEREDPFVLRLALDQSRRDFSKLLEKVSDKNFRTLQSCCDINS